MVTIKHQLVDGREVEIDVPDEVSKITVEPLSQLVMRFTGWLKVVVNRAKIDYVRHQRRYRAEISIDELLESELLVYDLEDFVSITDKTDFDFENDQIAFAFSKLTPGRSQVLKLLFVQNMSPQEVADDLHCSIQHVYNQRSLALKELKHILSKENE